MLSTVYQDLELLFRDAFRKLEIADSVPVVLQEASKPEFGDYQVNGAMAAAKHLKINPRELATKLIDAVVGDDLIEKMDIAGPGFINVTLKNDYLKKKTLSNPLSVENYRKDKIVVDYSAPNLAKEMHVGHLRSTIIGDALVRIYEYLGCEVIRRNHVGDWGTQFGMLTAYLQEIVGYPNFDMKISDLEDFYRQAKNRFDNDNEFASKARQYVVILQNNSQIDKGKFDLSIFDNDIRYSLINSTLAFDIRNYWDSFVKASLNCCDVIYQKLGVKLTRGDVVGESFYNDLLAPMVARLTENGMAVDSDGAKCVFISPEDLGSKEETPFIIQKKDGGYLYATTDIAAVYDRVERLHANRLVYVIDSRQSLHMKQLFVVTKKADIAKPETKMEHAAFGTMMGEDGKPFKTRTGGTVKLIDLINEAIERARNMISIRNSDWSSQQVNELADKLAIASIKYADLSKNRLSDYVFSFDKMLAFDGNTAPYLLYAYTRIVSIFKKASLEMSDIDLDNIKIESVEEHKLILHVAKFAERLTSAADENYPHYLCMYLYELSGLFMKFYEACPILKRENSIDIINSRLAIAAITANTLKICLSLLGIETVDKM